MTDNSIGNQIRLLREKRSLTQVQLADKLNVSKQTISNWEVGRKLPRMGYIEEMAKLFNVSKSEIIDAGEADSSKSSPTSTDLDDLLDTARSFDGKPMTEHDKEIIKGYLKGYYSAKE